MSPRAVFRIVPILQHLRHRSGHTARIGVTARAVIVFWATGIIVAALIPMCGNQWRNNGCFCSLCLTKAFQILPFSGNLEICYLQVFFRKINRLAVAVEEIGQTIGDVFRVERSRFGIAQHRTRQVAGRNDDETARSDIEDIA